MMPKTRYDERQLKDLLLQMMETELGGEKVYRTALQCAINEDLKEEWEKYLEETLSHQNVVRTTCEFLGINADEVTPSRQVVKHIGLSLVKAMELALSAGDRSAAQLVACECVVHAAQVARELAAVHEVRQGQLLQSMAAAQHLLHGRCGAGRQGLRQHHKAQADRKSVV